MRPVEEIRRENLITLIKEAGNASRLSDITGVPAPYISQVSRGVTHSAGSKPRVMGADIARKLEAKMGKPLGWMDADHTALRSTTELNGREGQMIGLFRLLADHEQIGLINDLTRQLRRPKSPDQAPGDTDPIRH